MLEDSYELRPVHFGGRTRTLCMEGLFRYFPEVLLTYALVYSTPRNSLVASSRDDGALRHRQPGTSIAHQT
jgi:hypothetical protein